MEKYGVTNRKELLEAERAQLKGKLSGELTKTASEVLEIRERVSHINEEIARIVDDENS